MWKQFHQTRNKDTNLISLSIHSSSIHFGKNFINQHNLKDYNYIEIFQDFKTNEVAFKFFKKRTKFSYKICNMDNGSKHIICRRFFKETLLNIITGKYHNYIVRENNNKLMFIIKLNN